MLSSVARTLLKLLPSSGKNKEIVGRDVTLQEESTAGLWSPLPFAHVVLFLDFDGVIHPCQNETFERMHLIEELLDACPAMVIIISSSWRECASVAYLKSIFRMPDRDRVIGATSLVYLPSGRTGVRAAECEDFVFAHQIKSFHLSG
ncbi:HAD domain-containing protein [Photorhabdus tasmaniensis]